MIVALYFVLYGRSAKSGKRGGKAIIICGPSGSGKTKLFLELTQGTLSKNTETVASVESNVATMDKSFNTVVDIPGISSVRTKLMQKALEEYAASTIVFTAHKYISKEDFHLEDVAFLMSAIALAIQKKVPSFVLVCTSKQKSTLEAQLKALLSRDATQDSLDSFDGTPNDLSVSISPKSLLKHLQIEDAPEAFSFSLLPFEVMFLECANCPPPEIAGKLLEIVCE